MSSCEEFLKVLGCAADTRVKVITFLNKISFFCVSSCEEFLDVLGCGADTRVKVVSIYYLIYY